MSARRGKARRTRVTAELVALISRFGLAGVANTVLGLGVTSALDLGFHVNPQVANAIGYSLGMIQSYFLNSMFVFRDKDATASRAPKYVAAMLIAFALNQCVLMAAGAGLPTAAWGHFAAQVVAMGTYTVSMFLMCRFWVFR